MHGVGRNLDVTLASGELINHWLANWLLTAAEDPASVKAIVIEKTSIGAVVEHQNTAGNAEGGILYVGWHGNVYVLGALDYQNKTMKRSSKEMLAALEHAHKRNRKTNRITWAYEYIVFGVVPLFAIWALYLLITYLLA